MAALVANDLTGPMHMFCNDRYRSDEHISSMAGTIRGMGGKVEHVSPLRDAAFVSFSPTSARRLLMASHDKGRRSLRGLEEEAERELLMESLVASLTGSLPDGMLHHVQILTPRSSAKVRIHAAVELFVPSRTLDGLTLSSSFSYPLPRTTRTTRTGSAPDAQPVSELLIETPPFVYPLSSSAPLLSTLFPSCCAAAGVGKYEG